MEEQGFDVIYKSGSSSNSTDSYLCLLLWLCFSELDLRVLFSLRVRGVGVIGSSGELDSGCCISLDLEKFISRSSTYLSAHNLFLYNLNIIRS
jgi:hypothetical protein